VYTPSHEDTLGQNDLPICRGSAILTRAMVQPERSRRQYITIAAVDPIAGTPCEVTISFERMQTVGRRSIGHARECGEIVPAILQHPTAVFEGLRWDEDEDRRGPAGGATAASRNMLISGTGRQSGPAKGRFTLYS